jgi:hypothetical protein
MKEYDIQNAHTLSLIKLDLLRAITATEDEEIVDINVHGPAIPVRAIELSEFLHKELEYADSRLKKLGITNLK